MAPDDPFMDPKAPRAVGASEEMSTGLQVDGDMTGISDLPNDLVRMASLPVDVESFTLLRGGDQLDEIGTTVPNGFIGHG
jgi:hypothetical protein